MIGKTIFIGFLFLLSLLCFVAVGGLDLLTGGRISTLQIASVAVLKLVRAKLEEVLPAGVLSGLTIAGAVVSDIVVAICLVIDVIRLAILVPVLAVWYSLTFVVLVVRHGYNGAITSRLAKMEMALLKKGRYTTPPLTRTGKGFLVFAPFLLTIEVEDDLVRFDTVSLKKFSFTKLVLGGDFVLFERAAQAASSPELRSAPQEQLIFEAVDQPPTKPTGKPRRQVGL